MSPLHVLSVAYLVHFTVHFTLLFVSFQEGVEKPEEKNVAEVSLDVKVESEVTATSAAVVEV